VRENQSNELVLTPKRRFEKFARKAERIDGFGGLAVPTIAVGFSYGTLFGLVPVVMLPPDPREPDPVGSVVRGKVGGEADCESTGRIHEREVQRGRIDV
jgi:hypothetical protein